MIQLRQFLMLGLIVFFVRCGFAQVYTGLSGGGGLDGRVSLRATIPVDVLVSRTVSVQSALVFTQQHNAQIVAKLGNERDYLRTTIWYAGIPVMVKARFVGNAISIYALAGPQVNYGFDFSASYVEVGYYKRQKLKFKELAISRLDIGVNAGLGLEKEISNRCKIFAELLILFNFYDIDNNTMSEIFNEGKIFNLGFLLPLKK